MSDYDKRAPSQPQSERPYDKERLGLAGGGAYGPGTSETAQSADRQVSEGPRRPLLRERVTQIVTHSTVRVEHWHRQAHEANVQRRAAMRLQQLLEQNPAVAEILEAMEMAGVLPVLPTPNLPLTAGLLGADAYLLRSE